MKKKILGCLLSVTMLASLLVCQVSAETAAIDGNSTFSVTDVSVPANSSAEYSVNVEETTSYLVSYEGANTSNIQIQANGKTISRRTGGNTVTSDANNHSRELHSEITLYPGLNTVKINTTNAIAATAAKVTFTKLSNVQYTTSVYNDAQLYPHVTFGEGVPENVPVGNICCNKLPEGSTVTMKANVPVSGWYYPEAAVGGTVQFQLGVNGTALSYTASAGVRYKANCSNDVTSSGFPYLRTSKIYLEAGEQTVTFTTPAGSENGAAYVGAVKFVAVKEFDGNNTFVAKDVAITTATVAEYHVNVDKTTSYLVSFEGASAKNIKVMASGKTINGGTGGNLVSDVEGNYAREFHNEITLNPGMNVVKISTTNSTAATIKKVTFTKLDNVQYTTSVWNEVQACPHVIFPEGVSPYVPNGNIKYSKMPAGTIVTIKANVPVSGWYYPEASVGGSVQFQMSVNGTSKPYIMNTDMRFKANSNDNLGAKGFPFVRAAMMYLEAGEQTVVLTTPAGSENGDAYVAAVKFVAVDVINANETFTINNVSIPAEGAAEYSVGVTERASFMVSFEGASAKNIKVMANGKTINSGTGGNLVSDVEGNYAREFHNEITLEPGMNVVKISTTNASAATIKKVTFTKLDNVQYTTSVWNEVQACPHVIFPEGVSPYVPNGNIKYSKMPAGTIVTIKANVPVSGWYYPEASVGGGVQFQMSVNGTSRPYIMNTDMRFKANSNDGLGAKGFPFVRASRMYLEAGEQTVVLTTPAGSENGDAYVAAVKFVATTAPEVVLAVTSATQENGVVTVDYTAPTGTTFDIIVANFAIEDGEKVLKKVAAPVTVTGEDKAGTEQFIVGTEGEISEVYVWNSLAGMDPLLDKTVIEIEE